jgi:DNA-binding PadR family transcriptional regulator
MNQNHDEIKAISREILLSFWKVHILHHATEGPVVGQWMLAELRSHGYEVSPGTLYPILKRMEERGWLRYEVDPQRGLRARKSYYLTDKGIEVLVMIRGQLEVLCREVIPATEAVDR